MLSLLGLNGAGNSEAYTSGKRNRPARLVCSQCAEQQNAAPNQLRLHLLKKPVEPLRVTAVKRIAGRRIRVHFPEELHVNLVLETIQKVQAEGLRF
jgi:hypothetical protein